MGDTKELYRWERDGADILIKWESEVLATISNKHPEEVARRITTCLNAMAGLTNEEVEDLIGTIKEAIGMRDWKDKEGVHIALNKLSDLIYPHIEGKGVDSNDT